MCIILVTGGAGFIASHVCEELLQRKSVSKVIAYDCLTYASSVNNIEGCKHNRRFIFVEGDVLDTDHLCHVLREHCVTHVLHMAAESHVDKSFSNAIDFTKVNTIGTQSVLIAIQSSPSVQLFVHMSTDEVYGTSGDSALNETALLNPSNPYAASKAAAEMFVRAYMQSYSLPSIVVRCNNVYGPRQHWEKVIPSFILKNLNNQSPVIDGSGDQLRTFVFVTDAADAIVEILLRGKVGETYNIGTDDEISIAKLALKLKCLMKSENNPIWSGKDRPFNDKRYFIDFSKLRRELNWKPVTEFSSGLSKTITWFQNVDMKSYWL